MRRRSGSTPRRPIVLVALAASAAVVALLGACTSDTEDDAVGVGTGAPGGVATAGAIAAEEVVGEEVVGEEMAGDEAMAVEEDVAQDSDVDPSAPGPGVVDSAVSGRRVVTAEVTVRTPDVAGAAARARDLAVDLGGFVASESVTGTGTDEGQDDRVAELRLRVPVEDAGGAVDALADLGEELQRTLDSEDVEGRLVDLESRLTTQRASIARIRELLDRAEDLEDVVVLEGELTRRIADLESLEARRGALADRAALATVTVSFVAPDAAVAAQVTDDDGTGFLEGLRAGWAAFTGVGLALATVFGAVLPFLVVLVPVALLAWVGVRRRRRSEHGAA